MKNDPTARVLQLLSLLQTHRSWRGSELAERLEVSDRTLRRDVDRLRGLGYPVEASPGVDGGYRLSAGSHMPPLVLDDEEAVAIAVGLRHAAGAAIDGIEEASVRALAKLEQVLPDRLRRRVSAVHANIVPLRWSGGGGPTVDPNALAVLAQACRDREEVRFDYRGRDGRGSQRLVEPHQLVSAGRRWYLVAMDLRREDWRTFRLDRLTRARLAGTNFTRREVPGGDAAAYVADSINALPRAVEATVLVRAEPAVIAEMRRWLDLTVDDTIHGTSRIRVRGDTMDQVVSAIATIGVRVELTVEGPPEAVAAVSALRGRLRVSESSDSKSVTAD